jgi:hypothetical protein
MYKKNALPKLDKLIEWRGKPEKIRSVNGPCQFSTFQQDIIINNDAYGSCKDSSPILKMPKQLQIYSFLLS